MPQIDLRDLPDSLFFASLPKSVRRSFLNSLRQVFLLVLLHPTRAGCLKCSFGSPLYCFSSWESDWGCAGPGAEPIWLPISAWMLVGISNPCLPSGAQCAPACSGVQSPLPFASSFHGSSVSL